MRSAVLTYSDNTGCFPPNTLFRLKEVKAPGTWEAPGGVYPQQRLLVVTATYLVPSKAQELGGSKLCASSSALSYGDRSAFAQGLDDLVGRPPLSMEQECTRPLSWKDWKGVEYTMWDAWKYVNGPAAVAFDCTPGTRDEGNAGKSPEDFVKDVNAFIASRRAAGYGLHLSDAFAWFTRDEVLGIRLYSGDTSVSSFAPYWLPPPGGDGTLTATLLRL